MTDKYLERYQNAFSQAKNEISGQDRRWQGTVCPQQYNKTCRLCTLAWKIIQDKNNQAPDMVDYAWELNQKIKVYMNVVRKSDPKKVIVLECGKKILKQLMDVQMEQPEAPQKNFFSFANGRNVTISKKGSGRNTEYMVRFEDKSKFPESVMARAHDLENIWKLRAEGKVPILRAAQLDEGPNQMRILPNWRLGEKTELFFFTVKYHTGLTQSEFDAVQRGEYNPFSSDLLPGDADMPGDPETEEEDLPFFSSDGDEDDVNEPESEDDLGFPEFATEDAPGEDEVTPSDAPPVTAPSRRRCFGNVADYEPDEEECRECPDIEDCGKEVEAKVRKKRGKKRAL